MQLHIAYTDVKQSKFIEMLVNIDDRIIFDSNLINFKINSWCTYTLKANYILNAFTGKKEETRKKKVNSLFDREFFKIRRVRIIIIVIVLL